MHVETVEGLRDIFIASQDSQNQYQLVKAFKKIYNQANFEEFWSEFRLMLLHPLQVFEREPAIEKTIDFVSKAVTDLALAKSKEHERKVQRNQDDSTCDDVEDDEMHPLLLKTFEFLLDVHSAKDRGVRFRVCQLITRLLDNLGEGAKIDDSLYDRIYECMKERLRDKCAIVRVHSVLALKRLQDPSDKNCPITLAYIILMTRDPNIEVRRIILTTISPSSFSVPAIIERTRDVKDTVRRTAYTVIAEKIPIKALDIEQRIKLLHDGLNDRSEIVKTACANKLLQAWLVVSEGNILDLLTRLDVQTSIKTCETALKILFKQSSIFDVVEQFTIIDDKALIPEDKLTCESAFYWRNVVQYVQNAGAEYDEQLDKVKPNCVLFCDYLKRTSNQLVECNDLDRMLDLEFIIQQFLQILLCMDLSDQASRRCVSDLLSHLLLSEHVGPSLVDHILPCLSQLHDEQEELVAVLAEIISEIREPIATVAKEIPKTDRRDLDKKIAGIRVKLNQLREELGECIEAQDFERAAQLKSDISSLDVERSSLLEESQPRMEEIRTQRNDPLTMLKCLTIVCELMMSSKIKSLSPTLQTLIETQALPGMTNEEAEVRNTAVKAIGLSCLVKKETIMNHLPLLLQASQMDTQVVRSTAMKCIFDIIHVYGLEAFRDETDDTNQEASKSQGDSQIDQSRVDNCTEIVNSSIATVNETTNLTTKNMTTDRTGWSDTAGKIISILSSTLDNESSELRTVSAEGLSKLLLSGRVCSSKLLSHLILLWYNPMVEDDDTLLQNLGFFFPLFAFANSTNQEALEEAFIPTLKTLLKAPSTSPLADVNEELVASFLVEMTDARLLVENQQSQANVQENPCHDNLARKLCNEILSKPDSFHVKLWLKTLNLLCLSVDNITVLKDLYSMCQDMAIVITDKQCVKLFDKFFDYVQDLYSELKDTQKANSLVNESEAVSESVSSQGSEDNLAQNMSNLSIREAEPATPVKPMSTRRTRNKAKVAKTPLTAKASQGSILKSASKSTKKMDTSTFDEVFATPAPVRASRLIGGDQAKVNLENVFSNCSSPTPTDTGKLSPEAGKTPKTPKRPLHSIQDPAFKE